MALFTNLRQALDFVNIQVEDNTQRFLDLFQVQREDDEHCMAFRWMGKPSLTVLWADGRPKKQYILHVRKYAMCDHMVVVNFKWFLSPFLSRYFQAVDISSK